MNRIDKAFENLKSKKEKALVGFVTAGDPDISSSVNIITAMVESGLDILELGIPFSDPTADGPVIQRSSARALKNGVNLKTVLKMTRTLRNVIEIPIILFSYYNPIHAYDAGAFYAEALTAGADGVLIVDLPPEESMEMTGRWPGNALSLIRLIAPTTSLARMSQVAASASGFLYLVSKTGVTGSGGLDMDDIRKKTESLRTVTGLPICVGFGISTADDVTAISSFADGVVIGSAFEHLIEKNLGNPRLSAIIAEKVKTLKESTKQHL
jgi:tryptophan synthase alpha chain